MLNSKQNNHGLQLIFVKHTFVFTFVLSLFFNNCISYSLWATPYADYTNKRLAILELQGEIGTIQQKQIWTDYVRSVAINLLKTEGILVIDRDQFKVLLDPQKSLSDCTDLCAAEMARELGAHWSLSGTLSKMSFEQAQDMMVTFKLHDASGTLLGVKQSHFSKKKDMTKYLDKMTRSLLIQNLVSKQVDSASHEDELQEENLPEKEFNVDESKTLKRLRLKQSTLVKTRSGLLCISPLIKTQEYEACVQQGVCTARPQWGNCRSKTDEPVTCVNLQQALLYSQWKASSLPSLSSLKALFAQTKLRPKVFEWTSPVLLSSSEKLKVWQETLIKLNDRELKTYPKQGLAQSKHTREQNQIIPKKYPPAFQVSHLSFRIATQDLSKCKSL